MSADALWEVREALEEMERRAYLRCGPGMAAFSDELAIIRAALARLAEVGCG